MEMQRGRSRKCMKCVSPPTKKINKQSRLWIIFKLKKANKWSERDKRSARYVGFNLLFTLHLINIIQYNSYLFFDHVPPATSSCLSLLQCTPSATRWRQKH